MRTLAIIASIFAFCSISSAKEQTVPFQIKSGHVYVSCSVSGVERSCLIDTGAATSAMDADLATGNMPEIARINVGSVGGKEHEMVVVRAPISFGGKDLLVDVGTLPLKLTTKTDVIIGEDVLSRFKSVTFDYKNSMVVFEQ